MARGRRGTALHRKHIARELPSRAWLAAGAMTVGIGAALAVGAGAASADTGATGGPKRSESSSSTPGSESHTGAKATASANRMARQQTAAPKPKADLAAAQQVSPDARSSTVGHRPPPKARTGLSPTSQYASPAATIATATPDSKVTLEGMFADVLTWNGFGFLAPVQNGPGTPLADFLAPLWTGIRHIEYGLNNQRPIAKPTLSAQDLDGVVTGQVNATDYDDTHLTYSVTGAPAHGTATVDQNGVITYTPDKATAVAGGTDQLVITIDDRPGNPEHIWGLLGAIGLLGPTTATVAVTVTPINQKPEAGNPAFTISSVSAAGVVKGTTNATDPEGKPLTYGLTKAVDLRYGTVDVDNATGNWTYIPSVAARDSAWLSSGDDTFNFSISANDGVRSTAIAVIAPISPAEAPAQHPFYGESIAGFAGFVDRFGTVKGSSPVVGYHGATFQTISYKDPTSGETVTRVAFMNHYLTDAIPGQPVGDVLIGADGTAYQAVNYEDPTTFKDTTTLVVLSAVGYRKAALPGQVISEPLFSKDGTTAYVSVYNVDTDAGLTTTVAAVTRDGETTHTLTGLPGNAGFGLLLHPVIGPDGTLYQLTSVQTGSQQDGNVVQRTYLGVLSPTGGWTVQQADGLPGPTAIGSDGTVYQTLVDVVTGPTPSDGSPPSYTFTARVARVTPGGLTVLPNVTSGLPVGDPFVATDGTIYQMLVDLPGGVTAVPVTKVAVISASGIATVSQQYTGSPFDGSGGVNQLVGSDGTGYVVLYNNDDEAKTGTTTMLAIKSGGVTAQTVSGDAGNTYINKPIGPLVAGPNGIAYQTLYSATTNTTTVRVITAGGITSYTETGSPGTFPSDNYFGVTLGADGKAYQPVVNWDGAKYVSTLIVLSGGAKSTVPVTGQMPVPVTAGSNGKLYLPFVTGTDANPLTSVNVKTGATITPVAQNIPGIPAGPVVLDPDGKLYLTVYTYNATTKTYTTTVRQFTA